MISLSPFFAHWPAINALLDEALSLPADEHAAWLAGLADERAAHREAVRALLVHHAAIPTDDFLANGPTLEPPAAHPANTGIAAGSAVGAYRLITEIGHGGMSTVWLAERSDGLMKRRVALKLPRIVWGDAFAQRLTREREILDVLEHEHIARLVDAGIDAQGRPFLAMELVEGEPIDAYCRSHALPVRERIALLLQVMAAVAHAHAHRVVHRDLKPGNILVSAGAKVSLLDFGIAKLMEGGLTEDTALTRAAGHALTPDYASPEQIRGEPLGTASDIYSLAVVAYELLAGGRPYRLERASAAQLQQAIAAAETPLASETASDKALRRQLQGDLDAILNKALKKQPDERYPTMNAFAQDLRRWRDGESVQARPDGLVYRAMKFVGRHRLRVATGSVVVAALVGGTTLALWQAHAARLEADHARTEAATAKALRGFIESVFLTHSADRSDRGAERIRHDLAGVPDAQFELSGVMFKMCVHRGRTERAVVVARHRLALAARVYGAGDPRTIDTEVALAEALAR